MSEKSLYQAQTKKASKADVKLVEKPEDKMKRMQVWLTEPDSTREEELGFLANRFSEMDDSRPDDQWDLRIQQYNAALNWREDGLANVNLPIEFATIRNKIADLQSSKTVVDFIPQEKDDIYKRDLYKDLWDFVWLEGDTEKELTKLWYSALIFGTGWWFEGLHKETFTKYEPSIDENGKITGKPTTITKSWLKGKALDIRDVWCDPVPDIEEAQDCFIRETEVSEEMLKGLLEDPNYDHEEVERMLYTSAKRGDHSGQRAVYTFQTKEELEDTTQEKYYLLHYYNREKGLYYVTDDNFSFILRKGVNPYPHGQLPISILIDSPNYQELYGKGECELLENTKYERNTIRNQIIDYARESNTLNFAVGENVAFEDSELLSGVMRVWNFQGNLGNTQFLKPPSQDSGLFNIDSLLRDDATWITGIDNNSLAGSPSKTAFEARLQEQAKLKGIMVTMRQYDYFLTRMGRQRLANIQFFLPYTTGKKIIGPGKMNKGTNYRTIPFTDKEAKPVRGLQGKKVVDKSVRLTEKEGETAFLELTPKIIKSNLDITVKTPTTTPILRELDRHDMQDIFNTLLQMAQTEHGMKLLEKFDFEAYYKDVITQKGFDPNKYMQGASEDEEKRKVRAKMLQNIPMAPKPLLEQTDTQQPQRDLRSLTPQAPQQ